MLIFVATTLAGGTWNQLHAPDAEASSFLKSNWNKFTENYHPAYILDGDPKTAWVEGVEGNGQGQWVSWEVSPVTQVHRVKLRVRNGYQKSDGLLAANAAPSKLKLELISKGRTVHTAPWTVARKMDWQELEIDPPADIAFDAVRLTVDAVTEGKTYADLCISDVEVFVDSETAYLAPVENAKQVALKKWIGERKSAAAYFASQPTEYPFAATHFSSSDGKGDKMAFMAKFPTWKGEFAGLNQGAYYRVTTKGEVRVPDGLHMPWELLPFLGEVTYFEAKEEMRPVETIMEQEWEMGRKQLSNVRRRVDGSKSTVTFKAITTWNERSTTTTHRQWRLDFEDEKLVSAVSTNLTDESEMECMSEGKWGGGQSWSIARTGGKIDRIEQTYYGACVPAGPEDYTSFTVNVYVADPHQ